MNNKIGKFITLEGIEGVGKSSHATFIANFLQRAGLDVILTREPGGTALGEDMRKILLNEYAFPTLPETELLLLYAGRLQHVEQVIKPALLQNKWVVCDRFVDATFAYQGAGRGISTKKIAILNEWALGDFAPDCTIVLDAPVDVAMQRIQNRRMDRFETQQIDFFERIRNAYLERARSHPERYQIVDASVSFSKVQLALSSILQTLVK
jgi:dTMP kinase